MFEDIIDKINQNVDDIISIGIWGIDGLELENIVYRESEIHYELFGAEAADIINKIFLTKVKCDKFTTKLNYSNNQLVLYPINEEFFYMIFTEKNAIINKLEFYLDLFNIDIVKKIS